MPFSAHNPQKPFDALGVYIFAGGHTIGMHDYFNIVGHCEQGDFGVATFRANFPHVPVWTEPSRWPRGERFKGVDVMYANPPCAPWSPVGRSIHRGADNWRTDPNVDCARKLIQYGLDLRPTIWSMESVPQIQRSEFLLDMAQIWLDAGYAFTLVREDAKAFGLPQQRRRCFMVAHRVEIPWSVDGLLVDELVPAGDALERAEVGPYREIEPQFRHLVAKMPPGTGLRKMWGDEHPDLINISSREHGQVKGRPLLMTRRVDPTRVSGVVIGMSVYIHPYEDRYLSHTELAALTGYPADYVWVNGARGRGDDRIAQVAKAVTPPAARFLGKNLETGLRAGVEAEVKSQRVTFWASSTRIEANNWMNVIEDWDVSHDCTTGIAPRSEVSVEQPVEVEEPEETPEKVEAVLA